MLEHEIKNKVLTIGNRSWGNFSAKGAMSSDRG